MVVRQLRIGKDHTVFSLIEGRVHFTDAKNKHKPGKKVINVVPHEDWPACWRRRRRRTRRSGLSAAREV